MALVVQSLPSKCDALSSNSSALKKKKPKKNIIRWYEWELSGPKQKVESLIRKSR
jgi:hypothetical protein